MTPIGTPHDNYGRSSAVSTTVTIAGERVDLTAAARADGALGEVTLAWGKHGTATAGLTAAYGTAITTARDHNVPLQDLVDSGKDLRFDPHGVTSDPDIPHVRSIVDWVARRLAADWSQQEQPTPRDSLAGHTTAETSGFPDAPSVTIPAPRSAAHDQELAAFHAELATGLGNPKLPLTRSRS